MIDVDRLRSEMRRQGMSQAVLAGAVEASPAAIQQILNGKTRETRLASKIARALGVSLYWLEGYDVDPDHKFKVTSQQEDLRPSVFLYFQSDNDYPKDGVILQRMLALSEYWSKDVFGTDNVAGEIIIYRVSSREMAPTLLPGDDVAIRSEEAYDGNPDSIWFFQYENRTFIRRLKRTATEELECSADNPAIAAFNVLESQILIRGRIVWQGRSLTA